MRLRCSLNLGSIGFAPSPLHLYKRPLLVGAHHPEMTGDVRGENCRRGFGTLARGNMQRIRRGGPADVAAEYAGFDVSRSRLTQILVGGGGASRVEAIRSPLVTRSKVKYLSTCSRKTKFTCEFP